MKLHYLFLIFCLLILTITILSSCDDENGTVSATTPSQQQIVNVSAVDAFNLIQENIGNPDFFIIDVRTLAEYNDGYIENALLVDYNSVNFQEEISKFDNNKTYLVYCRTGRRSSGAVNIVKELGFIFVYHMDGGITEWLAEDLPVVK